MRISTLLVAVAVATSGLALLAPAVGALDIGCVRAGADGTVDVTTLPAGTSTLITPPGQDILGWTPECVVIPDGGTVRFAQRDAIGHGVISDDGCINLGTMSTLGGTPVSSGRSVTSLQVEFDAAEGYAFTFENGVDFGACDGFAQEDGMLLIPYHCIIHGPGMPGLIKVEL